MLVGQAQKLFAADPESLKFLSENNIPSYFSVEPVDKESIQQLLSIRQSFVEQPGVLRADFPSDQITVLGKLKSFFGLRTYVMSGVLLFASVLLIWNTIRTAMFARRREIEVMKLVGATNWFIRLPFMLEGLLQGLAAPRSAASCCSSATPTGPRASASSRRRQDSVDLSSPTATRSASVIFMVLLGAFVGAVGSATAASRFLDVSPAMRDEPLCGTYSHRVTPRP